MPDSLALIEGNLADEVEDESGYGNQDISLHSEHEHRLESQDEEFCYGGSGQETSESYCDQSVANHLQAHAISNVLA